VLHSVTNELSDELIKQWHPTKNNVLTPFSFTSGSKQKVWWICDHGHEWQAVISSRSSGSGCPKCNIRKYKQPISPELLREWHPTKNIGINRDKLTAGSNKAVWWLCNQGHEYQAQINHRSKGNRKCPDCKVNVTKRKFKPIPEDLIKQWHPERNNNIPCDNLSVENDELIWWICNEGHEWREKIVVRAKKNKGCPTCNVLRQPPQPTIPMPNNLASQWHPTLNGTLLASNLSKWSRRKVWWLCKAGHEWQMSVHERSSGYACPECNRNRKKANLKSNEKLVDEWHPTKNLPITHEQATLGSQIKQNWICDKGHEWTATPFLRSKGLGKCPVCYPAKKARKILISQPHLMDEWHPTKNLPFTPEQVTLGSQIKHNWICELGHEWTATLAQRSKGYGKCPGCYPTKRKLPRLNTNPELVSEWHPTKNLPLTPELISTGSGKRVWWKCEKGHEWQVDIKNRAQKGSKCPQCRKKPISLDLMQEWHPTKNDSHPEAYSSSSQAKVWWICNQGHEWFARIRSRSQGGKCPFCAKSRHRYEEFLPTEFEAPTRINLQNLNER